LVIFIDHDTGMVLVADKTFDDIAMIKILIYRRDLNRLRQLCQPHLMTAGSLWCEVKITVKDMALVEAHKIWHEKLQGNV
jgi:hypothetical protein